MAKKSTSPDAAERKALLDYIKELDPKANFVAIGWQLKRMIDEGMTYSGIRYALWYSINVKQMPLMKKYMMRHIRNLRRYCN